MGWGGAAGGRGGGGRPSVQYGGMRGWVLGSWGCEGHQVGWGMGDGGWGGQSRDTATCLLHTASDRVIIPFLMSSASVVWPFLLSYGGSRWSILYQLPRRSSPGADTWRAVSGPSPLLRHGLSVGTRRGAEVAGTRVHRSFLPSGRSLDVWTKEPTFLAPRDTARWAGHGNQFWSTGTCFMVDPGFESRLEFAAVCRLAMGRARRLPTTTM